MYDWIIKTIPAKSNIIEFGAGFSSTKALSLNFNLNSIEHDPKYLNLYNSNYIYAPLDPEYGWYGIEYLQSLKLIVPKLVLIDGPPGSGKRFGVLRHLDLINKADYIVVDDTNRPSERLLSALLAESLAMNQIHFSNWSYLVRSTVN